LAAGILLATVLERAYLRSIHWSAVRRSNVEWPSVLMLGHRGWLVSALFVACGLLGILFSVALLQLRLLHSRDIAAGVALIGLALCVVAVPPDPPGSSDTSWHDHVHNWTYPVIPAVAILLQLRLALLHRSWQPETRMVVRLSRRLLPVTVAALAASNIDAVAQLARYFLFASIVSWLVGVALLAGRSPLRRAPRNTR
jgi:hypothetical protein